VIEVRDLRKNYAGFPALKGIDFRVETGEVVGFVGPNGAGKTTTLRILSGFMPASEGTVRVAGHDVNEASREVRRSVGYLPEDVPLYRDLPVDGFLRYMAGLKEVPASAVTSEVERVIEAAGLEPVRRRLIGKCSKGFRQRTGLAMALLGDPPVLLLDEPTSGLDPNQVVEVRELVRRLSGQKTVLLSSHILFEVAQVATRVLIIHQGTLVASGPPRELAGKLGIVRRLRVRTRGAVDPGLLSGVPGVNAVEAGGETGVLWVTVDDADRAGAEIARKLVREGRDLVELSPERGDLEAVFRAVTVEGSGA
jgi:ABC-type multidrug transport system ATPase subunit